MKIKGLFRRKRHGKESETWWMRFSANGKQHKVSTGTSDRRLAEKVLNKVKTQVAEGKWLDVNIAKQHNFDELMERYLDEHSKINKAVSTHEKDLYMKEHLKTFFEGKTLDQIDSDAILLYKNKRLREGAAQNTVLNELGMLRNALNIARHVWKWIKENPFSGLTLNLQANDVDRWLTKEEEEKLLEAAQGKLNGQLPDIILLDLHTGLSQEEILKLKWSQIDLSRKTLTTVRKKTKKKSRPARTIPLNATVVECLKRLAKVQSILGYVFFNEDGSPIGANRLKKAFKSAVKTAKIAYCRFHDLRHSFATRLVQKGVDLYKVSTLLGHSSIEVTQRYAHHWSESLRDGVDILDYQETKVLEKTEKKRKRKTKSA
ncbi:MAG TPA: site-specific integrase [Nitrospiraceae bacterium]|jgi:integrase|nr:site-specific integrase [Nitrospiraceae bacterium]